MHDAGGELPRTPGMRTSQNPQKAKFAEYYSTTFVNKGKRKEVLAVAEESFDGRERLRISL
jgi:hypothetical protein